jgi:DNA-binding response OmpR family regulator
MWLADGLESRGYQATTETSAAKAADVLNSQHVDAVVYDLTLRDGTAIDLLRKALRRPSVAIVLTGFDTREAVERTYAAGFDAHLDVLTCEVGARLRNLCARRGLASSRLAAVERVDDRPGWSGLRLETTLREG